MCLSKNNVNFTSPLEDYFSGEPQADPLLLLAAISERLVARPVKVRKPRVPKPPKVGEPLAQDLRHIVALGKQAGQSGYESLLTAGLVKPPLLDIAA